MGINNNNGRPAGSEALENTDCSSTGKVSSAASRKKRAGRAVLAVLAVILLACFVFSLPELSDLRNDLIRKAAESTVLMYKARVLKSDVMELADDIKAQNTAKAYLSQKKMQEDILSLRETLDKPLWRMSGSLPAVRQEFDDAKELLDILEEADRSIISPLLPLMEEYPLSELKIVNGLNGDALLKYLKYVHNVLPAAKDLTIRIKPLDLGRFDSSGTLKRLTGELEEITDILALMENADKTIVSRLIPVMEQYPFSELKSDSAVNDAALLEYLRFLHEAVPEVKKLVDSAGSLDLKSLGKHDAVAKAMGILEEIIPLVNIAEYADGQIIAPMIPVIEEYPLSAIKSDDGVNVGAVLKYLDLFEEILPAANELSVKVKALDLRWIDRNDSFPGYISKMDKYLEFGNDAAARLPVLKGILGSGGDRLYLLVAQNTSELRAAGGFPARVGTVSIKDGLLTISKLGSPWELFRDSVSKKTGVTSAEYMIFTGVFRHPRDASYCPDFERVAYIWAENYKGADPDGVISMTPVMIQKILREFGSVELSDGTVLNGENAMSILGHDFYFGYFSNNSGYSYYEADTITDALFNETAEKVLDMAMSELKPSNIPVFYSIFLEGIADRSVQIWMKDKSLQKLIRNEGWNSGMNKDKKNPEIAVFFNSTGGAKDTWFLDIDAKLSKPVVNKDGTRSYTLKLTFSNVMPSVERKYASEYLTGKRDGITGFIMVFAPAGGEISSFKIDPFSMVREYTYRGLDLRRTSSVSIKTSAPLVIKCVITTAPGVETVPAVRLPMLMTEFR